MPLTAALSLTCSLSFALAATAKLRIAVIYSLKATLQLCLNNLRLLGLTY
jgi:hypothetical protein